MQDGRALREQLLEAQMRRELGELSDREFAKIEEDLLALINVNRARNRTIDGRQPGALTVPRKSKSTRVEIETWTSEA